MMRLTKLVPLGISRGTSTGSNTLFVFVEKDGLTGIGECAPGTGQDESLAPLAARQIEEFVARGIAGLSIARIAERATEMEMESAAAAALDIALWDLQAKIAQMPLYQMLGLCKPTRATSVTIGINPPERIRELVPDLLERTKARSLKVKLGSREGIRADQAAYEEARKHARMAQASLRVDANGGWDPDEAIRMIAWLAERDCEYVEQPLEAGREGDLPAVFQGRKLPIFLDESIRTSHDVAKFADRCDGVNLKLMKSGGITEGLRVLATARAHNLKTMIGCMGDTSIAIAAGAAISSLCNYVDLDSHLNLNPDPATGLKLVSGVVLPRDVPGHGAHLL